MAIFGKDENAGLVMSAKELDKEFLPRHVAIIMDGNGRWAQKRGMPRTMGHKAGVEALREIIRYSDELGIEALTIYAFSTENWKRPRPEVEALFALLVEYIRREIDELHRNQVRLRIMGEIQYLPAAARREVERGCALTAENTGMVLNIALNYGSRFEIVRAARQLAQRVQEGTLQTDAIDEACFAQALYTQGLSDPDLLIRTSGEQRLSNFMLYQLAYAEFVFTEKHWPDFENEVYYECLMQYMHRERRFGAVGKV